MINLIQLDRVELLQTIRRLLSDLELNNLVHHSNY